jgi:hypothetical protein
VPAVALAVLTVALLAALPFVSETADAQTRVEVDGPPLARFWIDGREVGVLPLETPLMLAPGTYRLQAKLPGHRDYEHSLQVSDDEDVIYLRVRLTRYSRGAAVGSNLVLAGLGQHYLGRPLRGYVFNAAFLGGLFVALAAEVQRSNTRNDYLVYQQRYNDAIAPAEIERWRDRTESSYQDIQDLESIRNTGLMVTAGAVVLSMLDAFLFFPGDGGAPQPARPVSVGGTLPAPGTDAGLHVCVRLDF